MQIGELAELAQVNIQTIRYYEKRGIISPKSRRVSGFRMYDGEALKALNFIQKAKELGFTLEEIKELLELRATRKSQSERVRKKAKVKLEDIQDKLKVLKKMEKNLKTLISECEKQQTEGDCPIIRGMEKL